MNFPTVLLKRLLLGLIAGLVGASLTLLFFLPGWLDMWEAKTWDWRVNAMAKPAETTANIHLILLDQNSLGWAKEENGLSWPWPREVYNAIISFCQRSGAKALAFDLLFTEPSKYGVDDDRSFAAVIHDFKHFVGAVSLSQAGGSERRWPAFAGEPAFKVLGLDQWISATGGSEVVFSRGSFPIPEISASAGILGDVHLNPDRDKVYRRAALFHVFDGRVMPSLALGSFLFAKPEAPLKISTGSFYIGEQRIPIDNRGKQFSISAGLREPTRHIAPHQSSRVNFVSRKGKRPQLPILTPLEMPMYFLDSQHQACSTSARRRCPAFIPA